MYNLKVYCLNIVGVDFKSYKYGFKIVKYVFMWMIFGDKECFFIF